MFRIGRAMQPENTCMLHENHAHVAAAILAGEPDAAGSAMRRHLQRSHDWVMELPDSAFRREGSSESAAPDALVTS